MTACDQLDHTEDASHSRDDRLVTPFSPAAATPYHTSAALTFNSNSYQQAQQVIQQLQNAAIATKAKLDDQSQLPVMLKQVSITMLLLHCHSCKLHE